MLSRVSFCFYVARQAEVVGGFCCLFVRYWSFPPYFLLVLYIGTLRLSVQDIFKEIVKDYLIFQSISITDYSFIDFHKISTIDIFYSIKITCRFI